MIPANGPPLLKDGPLTADLSMYGEKRRVLPFLFSFYDPLFREISLEETSEGFAVLCLVAGHLIASLRSQSTRVRQEIVRP